MARPRNCRRVWALPGSEYFKPRGIPLSMLEEITLTIDEFEAIRLADLENLYQEQAADKMKISRPTFGRIIESAHIGIASPPLKATNFEPDIVMIYCDSAQLGLLLLGREYKEGYNLKCSISGHAACVYGVVPALQSGECQVAVPCRGDHYRAMAGDEEMIFTGPKEKLEDLMLGLRRIETTGSKLPAGYSFRPEYPLLESYKKIGKMMGYIK